MKSELFEEVERILQEKCECKQPVNMESVIQEDLQLDSLGLMTFVTILEEKYDLSLDELDETPETISDLIVEIKKKVA
jgi:acyl carrier protein